MRKQKKETEEMTRGMTNDMTAGTAGKKKKRHRKIPIVIAAVVVILIVLRVAGGAGAAQAGAVVTAVSAVRGDLQESISTSGTVLSEETKVIFAPVGGTLAEVYVSAGDAVKAGDKLVSYDMEKMEKALRQSALQLEKSRAGYDDVLAQDARSQADLSEARINLDVLNRQIEDNKAYLRKLQAQLEQSQRDTGNALAEESFLLQQKLSGLTPGTEEYNEVSSAISRNSYLQQVAGSSDYVTEMKKEIEDVQERIAGYEEYKARMESQKTSSEAAVMNSYDKTRQDADRELADLSYQETEEEYYIAKKGVTAEFDGIVTECGAVPGAGVNEGMQLLTLADSRNLKVSFEASKYDIEKLELGQKAEVVISGRSYQGEVSKINRMAQRNASNTPMVGAEIRLTDADDKIILGMDAKLTIFTRKAENVLLVPVEAVNADKEGDFLYVAENGVVVKKPVVCGISSDTYIEIKETSGSFGEDDQIIMGSRLDLEEGMPVTVLPAQ